MARKALMPSRIKINARQVYSKQKSRFSLAGLARLVRLVKFPQKSEEK
jgi:hypothetical protein